MEGTTLQARLAAVGLAICTVCKHVDEQECLNVCAVCGEAYCDSCPAVCQCDVDTAVESLA